MAARMLEQLLYPAVITGSALLAAGLLSVGLTPPLVVVAGSLVFALLCLAFERVHPARADWRMDASEARADLLHAALSNPLPTALFRALFLALLVAASDAITARVGMGLWPMGWALLPQVALALLVAEAASYAIHRFLHESRLWPLHAVHHCSRRMYFLLAVRKHPLQAFVSYGGRLSVLWLLGVPAETLTVLVVLTAAHSFVQHSNIRVRTGALSWVFATPELHRIHHGDREGELHANYGDVLIVWDALLGTRLAPDPAMADTDTVGLPGLEVEQSYASHLRLPFRMPRPDGARAGAMAGKTS